MPWFREKGEYKRFHICHTAKFTETFGVLGSTEKKHAQHKCFIYVLLNYKPICYCQVHLHWPIHHVRSSQHKNHLQWSCNHPQNIPWNVTMFAQVASKSLALCPLQQRHETNAHKKTDMLHIVYSPRLFSRMQFARGIYLIAKPREHVLPGQANMLYVLMFFQEKQQVACTHSAMFALVGQLSSWAAKSFKGHVQTCRCFWAHAARKFALQTVDASVFWFNFIWWKSKIIFSCDCRDSHPLLVFVFLIPNPILSNHHHIKCLHFFPLTHSLCACKVFENLWFWQRHHLLSVAIYGRKLHIRI